jgi:hypothetical protein
MERKGMKEKPGTIGELFMRLLGGCIMDYAWGPENLRLMVTSPVAAILGPGQEAIQVVLEHCQNLYYLSYTQPQEKRVLQQDCKAIFSQDLQILGVEERTGSQVILYCSTCLHELEAGELHFSARGFRLYDQEFGHLSYERFCRAADKYLRFFS